MVLPAPHHEAAPETPRAALDVDHARLVPRLEDAVERPAAVEAFDVRSEETPGPPPCASGQNQPGGRHQGARIKTPARAPKGIWRDVEVEAGHAAGGSQDPDELDQRRPWVGDVAQEVGEGHRVKRRVFEWQFLRARVPKP